MFNLMSNFSGSHHLHILFLKNTTNRIIPLCLDYLLFYKKQTTCHLVERRFYLVCNETVGHFRNV